MSVHSAGPLRPAPFTQPCLGVRAAPRTFGSRPLSDPFSPAKARLPSSSFSSPRGTPFQFPESLPVEFASPSASPPETPTQEEIELNFLDAVNGGKKANLPWLEEQVVESRCRDIGLREGPVANFINTSEFVSLGCFCGVTRALQCLGLKRFSYPFDWVRTNVPSTVLCFQRNFEDFCTSSFVGEGPAPGVQLHGHADWGGSFWHHNPNDRKVQIDFERRIKRLRGTSEVPRDMARVFCVSLNSLSDLAAIPQLRLQLEHMFSTSEVYLLVFIDNQPANGPIHIAYDDTLTLFYWIHEQMFSEMGKTWSEKRHAEAYAEGIAFAIRYWAGTETGENIPELESYSSLFEHCCNFHGGDPAEKLYWPMRVKSERTPRMPLGNRRQQTFNCALPWPLDVIMQPCGQNMDEEDDVEVVLKPAVAACSLPLPSPVGRTQTPL